jgi:hypothetical protein
VSGKYPGNIITTGADTGYSAYFDGTGDFLNVADNAAFELTGDFTIEGWFYLTNTVTTEQDLVSKWYSSGNFSYLLYVLSGSLRFAWSANGSTTNSISGGTVSLNTWFHAAISGSAASGTVRLFLNGVQVATQSTVTFYTSGTAPVYIMADNNGGTPIYTRGYASNVRILKGTNLYTAAFTPPTQLLNITNTSLLTCNSPAIIDQSTNAFAITANGDAKVSTFTPFAGYQAYNPALGSSTPGIWTVSEALQAAATRQWNMYDPYFRDTVLALRTSSTDGLQNNTFLDSSSNNFTITRNPTSGPNAPTQGTFTPFSQTGWGNYFDGNGDGFTISNSAEFDFGSGDFTIELWASFETHSHTHHLVSKRTSSGATNTNWTLEVVSGVANFYASNGSTFFINLLGGGVVSSIGVWYHIAVTRSGNDFKMFINGTQAGSTLTSSSSISSTSRNLNIGLDPSNSSNRINGYVSNLRIVKGTALYTSNFTPTTSPLTTVSGTSLLTCQSNRFIDNSSNAFAITLNGNPSVQAFSPFLPTAAYGTTIVGGSGYFDGTGDYLAFPTSNATLLAGTDQFTYELWFYPTLTTYVNDFLFSYGTTAGRLRVFVENGGLQVWNGPTQFTAGNTSLIKYGAWNHAVIQRNATNLVTYVNGTRDYNAANTTNFNGGSLQICADAGVDGFTGYISGFSFIKGSATYSGATITVPTAPPSPIGTTACLNFTNTGIFDATGKNNLETVGNAQASVAVRNTRLTPVPATSMYFDGTGDYFLAPYNKMQDLTQGDFTVEGWFYRGAIGVEHNIINNRFTTGGCLWRINTGNTVTFSIQGTTTTTITSTGTISATTWTHIAVTRSGSNLRIFINGTIDGSSASAANGTASTTVLRIGCDENLTNAFNGYIDDLRITKGYARYTGKFTPPTSLTQNQ